MAFYAAVHLIERLAAAEGVHNQRHTGNHSRQLYLSLHPAHHVFLADLTALRSASELARYDTLPAFSATWPSADVQVPARRIMLSGSADRPGPLIADQHARSEWLGAGLSRGQVSDGLVPRPVRQPTIREPIELLLRLRLLARREQPRQRLAQVRERINPQMLARAVG